MKKLKRMAWWLWVPVATLPGACHYKFTGPALWAHNSSAAFDVWVGIWIICIGIVAYATFIACIESCRK
jgi:hypothetical protein